MQLPAGQRRREIVEEARRDGRVTVAALAGRLGVAQETIRRDLVELELQGLVNRTHGGALPADRLTFEGPVHTRSEHRADEKARIARRALDELGEAEVVYVDEGSTAAAFAAALDPDRPLSVVTPSIVVAEILSGRPQVSVIQVGGEMRQQSKAVSGQWAVRMLSEVVLDLAILGANGVSRDHGLTAADPSVAAVKRTVLMQSRRSVLLTDSGKLGRDAFTSFGRLADVGTLITGSSAPRTLLGFIKSLGVRVLVV